MVMFVKTHTHINEYLTHLCTFSCLSVLAFIFFVYVFFVLSLRLFLHCSSKRHCIYKPGVLKTYVHRIQFFNTAANLLIMIFILYGVAEEQLGLYESHSDTVDLRSVRCR